VRSPAVKPRISSVSWLMSAFMKPRVSDSVRARSTACMGSFATRYGRPAATASFSLSPTRAIPDR
jgi:hypothetical protein